MARYSKSDMETRWDRRQGRQPAINVKVYRGFPTTDQVQAAFPECTEDQAEKALQYAFESAQERFWEDIQETAVEYLGGGVEVFQDGRMGGWLVVSGLPDVETWDALRVARWGRFERAVKADIADRCDWENVRDDIESNEWCKPFAERYNFVRTAVGTRTVADLNARLAQTRADFMAGK